MLEIIPVSGGRLKKEFIRFPYALYKKDPNWVPHLRLERTEMITPKKNPFFEHGKAELFLAKKEGEVVGRISAHINYLHNERYGEKTGHFGFFDAINDSEVSRVLFAKAEAALQEKGMTKIVGPLSFSINEEAGLLVEGFDSPPYPFMTHNFPYYDSLVSQAGYSKAKDLIAWKYDATRPIPEPAVQIADVVRQHPGLVIRAVNLKKMKEEMAIVRDVFNSAWANNWGFVPWTEAELNKMGKEMKLVLDPAGALIAEVDGKPAAICIAIPNYHDAIRDLNGRLFPFGLFRLLYRLKIKKTVKTARLCLLGVKKEFRGDILGGLSVLLYVEIHQRGQKLGYVGGELSWTLEENEKINNGIIFMGGIPYKKYRIYEKQLS